MMLPPGRTSNLMQSAGPSYGRATGPGSRRRLLRSSWPNSTTGRRRNNARLLVTRASLLASAALRLHLTLGRVPDVCAAAVLPNVGDVGHHRPLEYLRNGGRSDSQTASHFGPGQTPIQELLDRE